MAIQDDWSHPEMLYTLYTGIVTGEELLETALKKSGDPRFDDVKYIIGDWTEALLSYVSAEEIKQLVAYHKGMTKTCPYAKLATVVNRDRSGNALAAWYKLLCENLPWDVEIFYTLEDAEEWLEAPIPRRLLNEYAALHVAPQDDDDAPIDTHPATSQERDVRP
ncbi:hypothetical protein [Teredinibacter sp. KSP-S5-2]|uniref:hypothetical protein n=1 Tax=Teredinibacter sp. KSP-S5-2 TaxID=3034506 RepID=UPI002934C05C|nr:hypothetical protein [Teredinibacter sp. KSP-S5-2]WNO08763.1 hypothetical protein P5V12_17470 [Teredinibacter sp. KSP-S5-2]